MENSVDQSGLPELKDSEYPAYIVGDADRLRWRTAVGVARMLFENDGETQIWAATRVLYNSNIPTTSAP